MWVLESLKFPHICLVLLLQGALISFLVPHLADVEGESTPSLFSFEEMIPEFWEFLGVSTSMVCVYLFMIADGLERNPRNTHELPSWTLPSLSIQRNLIYFKIDPERISHPAVSKPPSSYWVFKSKVGNKQSTARSWDFVSWCEAAKNNHRPFRFRAWISDRPHTCDCGDMAADGFGYVTDDDPSLEYKRQLGAGGFGTVHEVLWFI